MSAILFGSISTVADTSELQREAFNQAFADHGLDWEWSRDAYRDLLSSSGGADRISTYAASRGEQVDAAAVHATKSERFRQMLASRGATARPGVLETVRRGHQEGLKIALVTTTARGNVEALLDALADELGVAPFDLVLDVCSVERPKPDDSVFRLALQRLGEEQEGCVAIEDNLGGVRAATAAGLSCVAFPNQNTAGQDFGEATLEVDHLEYLDLRALAAAA